VFQESGQTEVGHLGGATHQQQVVPLNVLVLDADRLAGAGRVAGFSVATGSVSE
jgi:hypothetical protein